MTDLEISKALALAIGWKETATDSAGHFCFVWDERMELLRKFDYRDWRVIGPIAEKLIVELIKGGSRGVVCWDAIHGMEGDDDHAVSTADTPQKAIALAVIKGAKK